MNRITKAFKAIIQDADTMQEYCKGCTQHQNCERNKKYCMPYLEHALEKEGKDGR